MNKGISALNRLNQFRDGFKNNNLWILGIQRGNRMEARDIFERDKLEEEISHQDPEYHKIREMIDEAQKLLFELNNKYHE